MKKTQSLILLILIVSVALACNLPGSVAPTPIPLTLTAAPSSQTTNSTETADEFYSGTIKWYDNLKTCNPYARTYLHPFLGVQEIDAIKGKDGDLCIVTQEAVGKILFECRYTAEGLKTVTQDVLYQDAKNKTMSTHNDVNEVFSQQCALTRLDTPQSTTSAGIAETATTAPTPTTMPTATPCVPTVTANTDVNVRSGPGLVYNIIGYLPSGATAPVSGKNSEASWWYIEFAAGSGGHAWVAGSATTATCIPATLAVVAAPPTPIPSPTLVPVPPTPTLIPPVAFAVTNVAFSVAGSCPNFSYTVSVSTNGAGTVNLHRIFSDGGTDTLPRTLTFAAAGTKSFTESLYFGAAGSSAWTDVYIDNPNHQRFGRANYSCP